MFSDSGGGMESSGVKWLRLVDVLNMLSKRILK